MPTTNARLRAAWHGKVADDPDDVEEGDWWYNTTTDEYRGYAAGSYGTIEFTPDA